MANKTIQLTDEFKARFREVKNLESQAYDLKQEQEMKARQLWMEIERHYNLRNQILKYNGSNETVEVVDTSGEEDKKILEQLRTGKIVPLNPGVGTPLPSLKTQKPWWKIW